MFIRILLHLLPAFSPSSSIVFHRLPNPPSALVSSAFFFFSPKLECFALEYIISELQQAVSGVRPFQQYVLPPMTCLRHSRATRSPNCLPPQEPVPSRRRLEQAELKCFCLDFAVAEHLQRPRWGNSTGTLASHVRRGWGGGLQKKTKQ